MFSNLFIFRHIGQKAHWTNLWNGINPRRILKCGIGGGAPYDLTDREGINAHVYIPLTVLYQHGLRLAHLNKQTSL